MSGKINAKNLEGDEAVASILKDNATKSAQIRALHAAGHDRSTIASILTNHYGKEVRYQHVRNVLVTKLSSES